MSFHLLSDWSNDGPPNRQGPLALLGLILPGLFGIRTGLTPLAASGLVIIMIGATTITAFAMAVAPALVPMTTGVMAAFVAYGRWRLAPSPSSHVTRCS